MRQQDTPNRSRWWRAAALTSSLLLVAAACGDDSDDSDTETDAGDDTEEAAEGDFGGQIVGIEAGAGLMNRTQDDVIPGYGLEDFELLESGTPAMLSELDSAISNEEWIVVTLWRPHWAYEAYDLKDLEDPEGHLGEGEDLEALGRTGFSEDFPEVAEWIENFSLTDDQLNELSNLVVQEYGDGQEAEAIEEWLGEDENQALVDEWLGDDPADGDGEEISIGWIAWDEDIAVTWLWESILTEQGYEVTQEGPLEVAPLYSGLASGDFDLFLDAWLPDTHEDYWAEFGDDIEQLGVWMDSATLHLTVPAYVPIDSIEELADYAG